VEKVSKRSILRDSGIGHQAMAKITRAELTWEKACESNA